MILNIVFIIIGISLVLWGADRMTSGAGALARRMNTVSYTHLTLPTKA